MKKEPNKCQNCHERDMEELFEVEINGKVKQICDTCFMGREEEMATNSANPPNSSDTICVERGDPASM